MGVPGACCRVLLPTAPLIALFGLPGKLSNHPSTVFDSKLHAPHAGAIEVLQLKGVFPDGHPLMH
jgi:hypothetical protein